MQQSWYFTGKAKWAKLKKPDEKYKKWTIDLYMDEKNMADFKRSGLQLKVKEDRDGEGDFVTFGRPIGKLWKGEFVEMVAPTVLDSNGNPTDVAIGNGSIVTVKVAVYDTVKGKGHTLEGVRIEELVEYKKAEPTGQDIESPF